MITAHTIRRARPQDASAIAQVRVSVWRDTYPGMLPSSFLTGMSTTREAIRRHASLSVPSSHFSEVVAEDDRGAILGFGSCGTHRPDGAIRAGGEIFEIYVDTDAQGRGIGRDLLGSMARGLLIAGHDSVVVWVVADNPSRWFYHHLGGRLSAQKVGRFGGEPLSLVAYVWPDRTSLARLAKRDP